MHNLEKEHCTSNGEAGFLSVSKVNMWHFTRAPIFLCEITSSISAAPEIAEGRHLCLLLNFFGSLKEKLSIKPLLTPKKYSVNDDGRLSKLSCFNHKLAKLSKHNFSGEQENKIP